MGTYLYVYGNAKRRQVYVGIGEGMTRPWEAHNADAEALLADPDTELLQTPEPFARREDARVAEAAAIYAASIAGVDVLSDLEDRNGRPLTNRAGVLQTQHLVPAVLRVPGTLSYSDLERTAIVVLRPGAIDERGTLHAARATATFVERASRTWPLRTARRLRYAPSRLVAILKGGHIVLGDWDLHPDEPVGDDHFNLADPTHDDPRGVKGMRFDWAGAHPSNLVTWSADIRRGFL